MERRTTDLETLARGGSLSFFGSAIGAALAMALLLVITWGLGADEAGAFFEAMALFNIVIIAVTFGADTGLLRFTSRFMALDEKQNVPRLLGIGIVPIVAAGMVAAAVGLMLAETLGTLLGDETHAATIASYIRILAIFVPVGALNLAVMGATRGYETMVPTVVAERIGRPAAQLALVGTVVLAGVGAGALATAWALGFALSLAAGLAWLRTLAKAHGVHLADVQHQPRWNLAREFWAFTLPRAFASIFRVGVLWLDVILVGALISPRAAAIYTVATRLLQAGFLAVDAIGQAVEPMFSSLLAGRHEDRAKSLYQVSTGWLVGLTWPLFLAMFIFSDTVLGLFGTDFDEGTTVVAILAGSALIGSGFGSVDILLVMAGKSMWSFWNSAAALSLNVGLNLLLIPEFGLNGAALAWAVSRIVANVLPLVELRSYLGFHPFGRGWRYAAIASLATFGVVGAVVRTIAGAGLVSFVAYLLIAGAGFAALVWRWRDPLDVSAFAALIKGRRKAEAPA